ncbi:MAG: DUF1893 domain-containing protein [Candidatus Woesearchaeota archaeon]|nr:DUF1893 domain-containing protein [Candidatus Woesearchaeota archaeon]
MNFSFLDYSLALLDSNERMIFSSRERHLKPLLECIKKFRGNASSCILYDRIIGLAASRLIAYSCFISEVITPVASKNAASFLKSKRINLNAGKIVDNILNSKKDGLCPMENLALKITDSKEFYEKITEKIRN